jgi:DNA-binding IclR family transcriptional regulator
MCHPFSDTPRNRYLLPNGKSLSRAFICLLVSVVEKFKLTGRILLSMGKTVKATEASFEIIDVLRSNQGMELHEITDQIDMSKPSVHSHLNTLENIGYVTKNGRQYSLSFQFFSLGYDILSMHAPLPAFRHQVESIVDQSGFHCTVMIEEENVGHIIYTEYGQYSRAPSQSLGVACPLHENASGKAILSQYEPERFDDFLQTLPPEGKLRSGPTASLENEIKQIRESGIAQNVERGVFAKAISFRFGDRIFAIGAHAPENQETTKIFNEELDEILLTARAELSEGSVE